MFTLLYRFGTYDEAAKRATERIKDLDGPNTTDMEALEDGHGRRKKEQQIREQKKRKRQEEEEGDEDEDEEEDEIGDGKAAVKKKKTLKIEKPKQNLASSKEAKGV